MTVPARLVKFSHFTCPECIRRKVTHDRRSPWLMLRLILQHLRKKRLEMWAYRRYGPMLPELEQVS